MRCCGLEGGAPTKTAEPCRPKTENTPCFHLRLPPTAIILSPAERWICCHLITDWNIQARAHACEACGKTFTDKQTYHTLLFDEKADFRRIDICETCWQKEYGEGAKDRKGFVSYWHGIYEAPAPAPEPIQKETAESLLRKVIELNDPHYVPAAFILAVMLERKRVLKVKEQILQNDGRRVFIYEQARTGDVFTVVDPNLQLGQLESVQHDVAMLLEHGFNPLPPPTADAALAAAAPADSAPADDSPASPQSSETSAQPEVQPETAKPENL